MKRLFIILVILVMAVSVNADILKWDAATGDVGGYIVYYGTVSGEYSLNKDVGDVLQVGVPDQDGALADYLGLNPGTWYIIVRAYNVVGESGNSNIADHEVVGYVIPADKLPVKIFLPGEVTIIIENN